MSTEIENLKTYGTFIIVLAHHPLPAFSHRQRS